MGEVYNMGGGKGNSCSILEAFALAAKFSGKKQVYTYVPENRLGDHICYYSDLRKMRAHYPAWDITISLEETIRQIVEGWQGRLCNLTLPPSYLRPFIPCHPNHHRILRLRGNAPRNSFWL